MYQAKVKQVSEYSDGQGTHTVCKGNLILVESKKEKDITSPYALWLSDEEGIFMNPYDNPFELLREYTLLKSIIISETEEIEEGDKVLVENDIFEWNEKLNRFVKIYNKDIADGLKTYIEIEDINIYDKILVLPDQFSDKHLQAIVDGKMKDKDEVLVKCEDTPEGWYIYVPSGKYHADESVLMKENLSNSDEKLYPIHLDQQNHITLFPAKQSLEEAAKQSAEESFSLKNKENDILNAVHINAFRDGAEWAKKNNY